MVQLATYNGADRPRQTRQTQTHTHTDTHTKKSVADVLKHTHTHMIMLKQRPFGSQDDGDQDYQAFNHIRDSMAIDGRDSIGGSTRFPSTFLKLDGSGQSFKPLSIARQSFELELEDRLQVHGFRPSRDSVDARASVVVGADVAAGELPAAPFRAFVLGGGSIAAVHAAAQAVVDRIEGLGPAAGAEQALQAWKQSSEKSFGAILVAESSADLLSRAQVICRWACCSCSSY